MNAIELAAAFSTVEQDHHFVVDKLQALQEVVAALLSPADVDAAQVFGRLRDLDNYFVTQFTIHMDDEEKTLFPLLEQFPPDGTALAERLRREHVALRRKLDDFRNCLDVAVQLQDRPPRVVLRDLLRDTWELWDLVDKHAHAETRGIHECLTQHLETNPPGERKAEE
jgi:hemerythrin-like domain-containing protein